MTEQDYRNSSNEKKELKKWKEFSLGAIMAAAFAVISIYFDVQTINYILAARDLCTLGSSCAANLATDNLTSDAITSLGGSILVTGVAITTIISTYVGTRISIKIQKTRN